MPELSFLRKCRLTSVHWKEGEVALTCQFLQQVPCFYTIHFDVGIDVDVDVNFVDLDDYLLAALTCQFLQQVSCFYV